MSGLEYSDSENVGLKIESTFKLDEEQEAQLRTILEQKISSMEAQVKNAEKNSSTVGKLWSWAKNNVPFLDKITDSSNEVRVQAQKELQILKSKNINEAFSELTGLEYNAENVNKFLSSQEDGEIKLKSEQALEAYKSGQESSADFVSDMIAGAGSMVIYSAAVAAVLAGGAPIGLAAIVGLTGAGVLGAGVKVGIKALDAATGGKEYKVNGKDLLFGALNGIITPLTAGFGGKIGASIVTNKLKGTVVKEGGELLARNVASDTAENGFKAFVQDALVNPAGNYYYGDTKTKVIGYVAELGFDGGASGAIDAGARTAYDGGSATDIAQSALGGFVGGSVAGIGLGGIFKFSGSKAHQKGAEVGERFRARNTDSEQLSITDRLTTASSREEFVAIRDEIKAMPMGAEKTALQQEYLRK